MFSKNFSTILIIQFLRGEDNTGSLHLVKGATIDAGRGSNLLEVLQFLSYALGVGTIETHKRDQWYPYVYVDGAIRAERYDGFRKWMSRCL